MAPQPCRAPSFPGSCGADGAVRPPHPAGRARSPSTGNRATRCITLSTAGRVGRRALAVCVRRESRCPLSPRSSATSSASPGSGPTRTVVGRDLLPCRAAAPVGSSAPSTARFPPWCTPCAASGAASPPPPGALRRRGWAGARLSSRRRRRTVSAGSVLRAPVIGAGDSVRVPCIHGPGATCGLSAP